LARFKNAVLSFRAFFEIVDIKDVVKKYFEFLSKNKLYLSFILFNFTMFIIFSMPIVFFKENIIYLLSEKFITITSIFTPLLLSVLILIHYDIERTFKNAELLKIPKEKKRKYLKLRLQFLQGIRTLVVMSFMLCFIILIFSILFLISLKTINISKDKDNLTLLVNLFKFSFLLIIIFPNNITLFNLIIIAFRINRLIKHEVELIEWISDNYVNKDLDNKN